MLRVIVEEEHAMDGSGHVDWSRVLRHDYVVEYVYVRVYVCIVTTRLFRQKVV
jgi:hypothetical protein